MSPANVLFVLNSEIRPRLLQTARFGRSCGLENKSEVETDGGPAGHMNSADGTCANADAVVIVPDPTSNNEPQGCQYTSALTRGDGQKDIRQTSRSI